MPSGHILAKALNFMILQVATGRAATDGRLSGYRTVDVAPMDMGLIFMGKSEVSEIQSFDDWQSDNPSSLIFS